MEADFISAAETAVTLNEAGGKPFTPELSKRPAEDQEFVKMQAAVPDAKPAGGNPLGRRALSRASQATTQRCAAAPTFPPSGPATGSFNGFHHKRRFLVMRSFEWSGVSISKWNGVVTGSRNAKRG